MKPLINDVKSIKRFNETINKRYKTINCFKTLMKPLIYIMNQLTVVKNIETLNISYKTINYRNKELIKLLTDE